MKKTAYILVIFVISAISFGIFFHKQNTSGSDYLYRQYFVAYEDKILNKGKATEGGQAFLEAGMEAYNHEQYQLAAEYLKKYMFQAQTHHGVALYLGISQMELDKFEAAEENFRLAMKDAEFEQPAQWYLALLFIKSNQSEEAMVSLRAIVQDKEHYKYEAANTLAEKLR